MFSHIVQKLILTVFYDFSAHSYRQRGQGQNIASVNIGKGIDVSMPLDICMIKLRVIYPYSREGITQYVTWITFIETGYLSANM